MAEILKISLTDYEKEAIEWAKRYANDIETTERVVGYSEPYRYCVVDLYKKFVDDGKLLRIEKIPQAEKGDLFNKSKELFPSVSNEQRKSVCIFLYFMNFIFEKYFI